MKPMTRSEWAGLRTVLPLLEVDWKAFALSLLLGAGALGSAIALSATSAWLIARAAQHPPVLYLTVATVSVRLFGVSRAVLRYAQRLASHRVALEGMDALRQNLYGALATRRIDRVASLKRGDLLARTGADVDDVGDLVVKTILPVFVAALVALGTVLGLSMISPATALLVALCLLISGVGAPLLAMKAARIAQIDTIRARTTLTSQALNLLEGASELQVSGRLSQLRAGIERTESELTDASHRATRMAALASGIDRAAMGLAVVGALLIGIPQTSSGMIAGVLLAVLVLTPLASFEGTAELAPAAAQLVKSATAAVRIAELLHSEEEPPPHPVPESAHPQLKARGLAIGWPGGPTLVDNLDLDLEVGRSLGIVGASGIGKTTLALTLAGLLPPKKGTVTLNGVDVWGAERADFSRHATVTAEDAHIFAASVLENLRVANALLSPEDAQRLLERVGLGHWLDTLVAGLDTPIGSGGTTVSGGERRRLLIARALASPAPLLLLDEASEHLDAHSADALIEELLRDKTRGILLISHRLSALGAADEILVLASTEPGPATVVARGTHEDLTCTLATYRWALAQEESR